jgi:nitrite reductase/ring-hydroxylating ferredoxin subunit
MRPPQCLTCPKDMPQPFLSRRGWIKRFVLGTAVSSSGAVLMLAEVAEASTAKPARLRLRVADYPALQSTGGSVQLQFSSIYPPLTVNRVSTTEFATLDSVCTHAGCTVGKFIAANGYMRCPCHGSRYNARGQVVLGPAEANLNAFETTFDAAAGVIEAAVPGLGLNVNTFQQQAQTGGVKRLRLAFQATAFATYQVLYMTAPGGTPAVQSFSRTAGGVANQTSLTANDDAEFTVYVDATGERGFYVIALQLTAI